MMIGMFSGKQAALQRGILLRASAFELGSILSYSQDNNNNNNIRAWYSKHTSHGGQQKRP